jgi:hypothetical protein
MTRLLIGQALTKVVGKGLGTQGFDRSIIFMPFSFGWLGLDIEFIDNLKDL